MADAASEAAFVYTGLHASDQATFVYTGFSNPAVGYMPQDAVRVRIDHTVLAIPMNAFALRTKLETVELHDNLRDIGPGAFSQCIALKDIVIPSNLRAIGDGAFNIVGC